jgi:hypothetical protein
VENMHKWTHVLFARRRLVVGGFVRSYVCNLAKGLYLNSSRPLATIVASLSPPVCKGEGVRRLRDSPMKGYPRKETR